MIGLTGGIGSGKSTIARILQNMGYPVYVSDREASRLMNTDPGIIGELKKVLGDNLYTSKGVLDKKKLAAIIFNDKNLLAKVNTIVHPRVMEHFRQWAQKQQVSLIFFESAILFESGLNLHFRHIICVTASRATRLERVMLRDHTSLEKVEERMNNQMDEQQKCLRANYVIYNDKTHLLLEQVLTIINQLKTSEKTTNT